jgi:hypothetical protein
MPCWLILACWLIFFGTACFVKADKADPFNLAVSLLALGGCVLIRPSHPRPWVLHPANESAATPSAAAAARSPSRIAERIAASAKLIRSLGYLIAWSVLEPHWASRRLQDDSGGGCTGERVL